MGFPATQQALREAGYARESYSRCSGCKTAMEWWRTPKGQRIPMDSMKHDDSPAVSHFSTCPEAKQFRKQPQKETKPDPTPSLFDGGQE